MARQQPKRQAQKYGRHEQVDHRRLERTSKGEGQSDCEHRQAKVVKRREGAQGYRVLPRVPRDRRRAAAVPGWVW